MFTKEENNIYLNLSSKTWDKGVKGLFDYSSKDITEFKTAINDKIYLLRKDKEIIQQNFNWDNNIEKEKEKLFCVEKINNEKYIFENNVEKNMEHNESNINLINNKIWYITNKINKKYFLTKNDIIKLGRVKYIISEDSIYSGDIKYELNIPSNDNNNISLINKQNENSENIFNVIKEVNYLSTEENNSQEKILCKICYSEQIDFINNPMVHLCNCKGYLNYAHFDCIKQWIKTKIILKENYKKTVKTYYIPKFNCEICKVPFPYKFRLKNKNKIYELIDIERPSCNYIILESLLHIKENNENNKFIHVINLKNEDGIIIGRSNEVDIKINDISVSRFHAKLKFNFEKKSLEIIDLKSKFGTLILIKNNFELNFGDNLMFQIGRTIFKTEVIKKEINKDKINDEENKEDKNNFFDEGKTEHVGNDSEINNNLNLDNYNKFLFNEESENENDNKSKNNNNIENNMEIN